MKEEMERTERTGFFVVDRGSRKVLYSDPGARLLFPAMREGEACYRALGRDAPCGDCPVELLEKNSAVASYRAEVGMNAAVFRLSGQPPRALIFYGEFSLDERKKWMENGRYQIILRQNHTIAFEFDIQSGESFISPFAQEILAGRYDGRPLIRLLTEDGVVHPEDRARLVEFRLKSIESREKGAIRVRLKTVDGPYRWYRITVTTYRDEALGRDIRMGTVTDADEEVRLRDRFRQQFEYDDLTGIYHRAAFYRRTKQILETDTARPHYLVVLDIDRFKMVNALFDVAEGDKLLKALGRIIAERMRFGETYGRLRDDVFALCTVRSKGDTLALLRELEAALRTGPIPFHITLSAGICRLERAETTPVNVLCDRAALALRSVKDSAVKKHAFYTPGMGTALQQEQEMAAAVFQGLDAKEFTMWLQPKVLLHTGELTGAEALVRWERPEHGLVQPDGFIPLLERNGLITLLDKYVWETVCRTLRKWLDAGLEPPPVSVNLSRIHFYNSDFAEVLVALTAQYGIPPRLLELELTESAYVENPNLREIMERLKAAGFTFAMDDFGSGYSSLNMLRSIPVDVLKIDLHFLSYAWEDEPGKVILKSVVGMARDLHIPVIAEGVETTEQAAFLKEIGCTMAQGYLYARPMPIPQFEVQYLGLPLGTPDSTRFINLKSKEVVLLNKRELPDRV